MPNLIFFFCCCCWLYTASATVEERRTIGRMEGSIKDVEERLMKQNTAEQRQNLAVERGSVTGGALVSAGPRLV